MTILQDLEAARDALEMCIPEGMDVKEARRAALSRLSTLIEQVRGQEPAVDVEKLELVELLSAIVKTRHEHFLDHEVEGMHNWDERARAALRMHLTGGKP